MDFWHGGIIFPIGDYGVNGWKVDQEKSMEEFYNEYNIPMDCKEKGPKIIARKKGSEEVVRLHKKASFLPIKPKYILDQKALFAFIIQPTNGEESIVNERKGLDHGQPQYQDASSIPIGVPVNAISGILISEELVNDKERISQLIELFPEQYITTPYGELIYEPNKEKKQELPIAVDTKESMKTIASEITGKSIENASTEIKGNYKEFTNDKSTNAISTDDISIDE